MKISQKATEIMLTQLKVREATNKNDGEAVESYLKSVNLGKGYSWCMAFIYWAFSQAAKQLQDVNPVPRTAGVLDCMNKCKEKYVLTKVPQPYDQFIMDFGKGAGHTGMVTQILGKNIKTIEGNTAADPKLSVEDREGNGVFERIRPISSIKIFIRYV